MKITPVDPLCSRCRLRKSKHSQPIGPAGVALCAGGSGFRRRGEDMPGLAAAPHPDVPLGPYVHVKTGNRYEVIGGALDATTNGDEVLVLYQAVHGGLCVRALPEFQARFRAVGSESA